MGMAAAQPLYVLSFLFFCLACFIPCVVVVHAAEDASDSAATAPWETSLIWPAVRGIEEYYDADYILRTYTLGKIGEHPLQMLLAPERDDDDDDDDIEYMFDQAMQRFAIRLWNAVPDDDDDSTDALYPVNPTQAQLLPLGPLYCNVTSRNTTLAGADERYRLSWDAPDAPAATLAAETIYGILHGTQTLLQVLQFGWMDPATGAPVFVLRRIPQWIEDAPLYAYRGILVDTSRHFLPITTMLQPHIDLMAAHKLNVLHWHLMDDESWPWQSESFPELADARHCESCIYTTANLTHAVVQYARLRGVRVVVEVDTPGHTKAIGKSHPEWLTLCGDTATRSGPLDVTQPGVYAFLDQLYAELVAIFPDPYIHIGGDEIQLDCWNHSRPLRQWMQLHNLTELVHVLEYYEAYVLHLVQDRHHRTPIVWQDVFDYGAELPRDNLVLDVWKDWMRDGSLYNITAAGYDVILSAGWYLDHLEADWWKLYTNNPRDILPNSTAAQRRHVLGGHASMWGERVDATNFMERVWPRASSVAEVLWSGSPTTNHTSPLEKHVIQDRLSQHRCWLLRHFPGIPISPIAPGSCHVGPIESTEGLATAE